MKQLRGRQGITVDCVGGRMRAQISPNLAHSKVLRNNVIDTRHKEISTH